MCLSKYEVVLYHFLCWGQEIITVLDCPVEEVKKYYGHSMFISENILVHTVLLSGAVKRL